MGDSLEARPYFVLGLDIGIGSLGWCIIDIANEKLIDMGVHLWEVPQEQKTKISTATTRRNARSARRNFRRHANRMKKCLEVLVCYGVLPDGATSASLQTIKGDLQPLQSRVAALDRLLTDREFAQALYNICNRRGYIPHGDAEGDVEGKKVLGAIERNAEILEKAGYRTCGEMMLREGEAKGAPCGSSRNKSGNYDHCVEMSQLLAEIDAIFESQRRFGNAKATCSFQNDFKTCMSWQKPTYDRDEVVYGTVGRCVYFPDEKRAAKACLSFERCVAFERICNVRYVTPDGVEHSLPPSIRKKAMDQCFAPVKPKAAYTYNKIKNDLDLCERAYFKNVSEKELSKPIYEPRAWCKLRNTLDTEFVNRLLVDCDLADDICSALAFASTEQSLRSRLIELCGLGKLANSQIDAICKLPYSSSAFNGYGMRSLKALRMLNDAFCDYETITSLSEAESSCGLFAKRLTPDAPLGSKLPPYSVFDQTCKNPVVLRVMGRVRKVVNAIISKYGIPDEIHIELSRDLNRSAHEKKLIDQRNRDRKGKYDAARGVIAERFGCDPDEVSGKLVRKYVLWDEQNGRDIYTNEPINIDRLLNEGDTYCQIDHILLYSRTCDNSQTNKVLVLSKSNQDKGKRSPFEWLSEAGQWSLFKERILELSSGKNGYPRRKASKLLEERLAEKQGDFIDRNLNDTRYASRAAANYIEHCLLFPDSTSPNGRTVKRRVCAVAGGATSELRHYWGFDAKDRDKDDCHHAVDAAIVAACDSSTVQKVARYSEGKYRIPKEKRATMLKGTEPWLGFSTQVQELASRVIPTRKVEHGVTGRLFEDTIYRFEGMNEKGSKAILFASNTKKKRNPCGNYVINEKGEVRKPDGMMLLRLWWDPDGNKGKGCYLSEPVYYSDLGRMKSKTYSYIYCVRDKPRCEWPEVPQRLIDSTKPIVLRRGQLITFGGDLLRFQRFDSSGNKVILSELRKFSETARPKQPISKARSSDFVKVVEEDILGDCFKSVATLEE